MKNKFSVGDEVICTEYGRGIVIEIDGSTSYPIVVSFGRSGQDSYTLDGRMYIGTDDHGEHIHKLTKLDKALT